MRLTLTNDEITTIVVMLDNQQELNLAKKIRTQWYKPITMTKRNATKKAIEIKQQKAKNKIINAINLMNLENKKINFNSVAKVSGCSYNTVKKYNHLFIQID